MRNRVKRETLEDARKLRAEPTAFEKALWRELRLLKSQGYHFRRQAPFRGYILDFVEHGARLIIELDGVHHYQPGQVRHDLVRESVLERESYRVLHFENGEVQWIGDVVATIKRELAKRKPPPGTLRVPTSPQRGRYIWDRNR